MPYDIERIPAGEAADLDVRLKFRGEAVVDFYLSPAFLAYYGDGEGIRRGALELAGFLYHYRDLADKAPLFALMGWPADALMESRVSATARNFRARVDSEYNRARAADPSLEFSTFFRASLSVVGLCADL